MHSFSNSNFLLLLYLKYFEDYKCETYSKDKLVEVKEDWTTFMVEYISEFRFLFQQFSFVFFNFELF